MRRIDGRCGALAAALLLAACAQQTQAPSVATHIPVAPRSRASAPAFTGLGESALRSRLGAPAFVRADGPTTLWRYDGKNCRAFFFFAGGKVSHVETIPTGAAGPADPACLNALKPGPSS